MTLLPIVVPHPAAAELLIARGWLKEQDHDDVEAIGRALSAAIAAWVADPARGLELPTAPTLADREASGAAP